MPFIRESSVNSSQELTTTSSDGEYSLYSTILEDGLIRRVDSHTHLHILPLFICVVSHQESHYSTYEKMTAEKLAILQLT